MRRRLRAAWHTLRTGRGYYDGYYTGRSIGYKAGQKAGYSEGMDDAEIIDAAITARLTQPTVTHPTIAERRKHLSLVGSVTP